MILMHTNDNCDFAEGVSLKSCNIDDCAVNIDECVLIPFYDGNGLLFEVFEESANHNIGTLGLDNFIEVYNKYKDTK